MRPLAIALALCTVLAPHAAADDGVRFRRTTPRAVVSMRGDALVLGLPRGRAWGIESALRRAPGGPAVLVVDVGVADDAIREAFVRVAWYAREHGRQRQLAIVDSELVRDGDRRALVAPLEPPDGAVAYRVRVLARVRPDASRSDEDAVIVGVAQVRAAARAALTRLVP